MSESPLPTTPQEMFAASRALMDQYGLRHWFLKLSGGKRRLGSCAYRSHTLRLSRHLLLHNGWTEVRDTILHEIAHALVGDKHGHDAVWKAKARELGATPRATTRRHQVTMPAPQWEAWCPVCVVTVAKYYRRPRYWRRGYLHKDCRNKVQFRRVVGTK